MKSSCCVFEESILDQALPPILFLEFILGLLGNSLGLWMICLQVKSWKPNSIYLLSLTLADFLVLCCVLFRADYYIRRKDWMYGDVPCRMLLYILAACRAAGIIFLTVIAMDRYCRLLFPFHRLNKITVRDAAVFCCLLWLGILAMYSYLLTEPHFFNMNNSTQCESFNICPISFSSLAWHDAFYISMSFLALCIISYCTICIALHLKNNTIDKNGKAKRAVKFILAIAVIFTVCYLPSTIVRISIWILKFQKIEDCAYYKDYNLAFYTTVCFTYFYSMLNPIIYYFSSPSSQLATTFSNIFPKVLSGIAGRSQFGS